MYPNMLQAFRVSIVWWPNSVTSEVQSLVSNAGSDTWVTLGNLFILSSPQLSYLLNEDNKVTVLKIRWVNAYKHFGKTAPEFL